MSLTFDLDMSDAVAIGVTNKIPDSVVWLSSLLLLLGRYLQLLLLLLMLLPNVLTFDLIVGVVAEPSAAVTSSPAMSFQL
jgi:hypothetical protein